MHNLTDTTEYKYIMQLPKDKEVLDYIFSQLSVDGKQDWNTLLEELLVMHRSSSGFNPMVMGKGRFKRLKAAEFRVVLSEINMELQALLHSEKYLDFLKKRFGNKELRSRFNELIFLLDLDHFDSSIKDKFIQIKTELLMIGEYEMLLQLFKNGQHFIEKSFPDELHTYMLEFVDIQNRVQINSDHIVSCFKTVALLHKARMGVFEQNEAVMLYDDLCKLLIRHKSIRSKYETLINILEISSLLDNRSHYMEPYINFTAENFEEILHTVPEKSNAIHCNLAKYMVEESLPVRLNHLNKAMKQACDAKNIEEQIHFKIVHAELASDSGNIESALSLLDEAFLLSLQSENNEEVIAARAKVLMTRMFILSYLHFADNDRLALKEMNKTLKQLESESSLRLDHAVLVNENKALVHLAKGEIDEAKQLFSKSAKARENNSYPFQYYINSYFQELLRKKPAMDILNGIIDKLLSLNEPFYSSICVSMLESVTKKMVIGIKQPN